MSRIKLPAVEETVVFGRLLNGVRGPQLCGLSNNPDVLPLLAPLALSSSFHEGTGRKKSAPIFLSLFSLFIFRDLCTEHASFSLQSALGPSAM